MISCPLCNSTDHRSFPIYYKLKEKSFNAKQCKNCDFVFLDPRPSPEDLKLMYSDEYFLHDGADFGAHSPTDYETAAIRGSVKFPEILGWIMKFKGTGKFFEIGCGMGYFLDYARKHGYDVEGIEYSALGTKMCAEKFGLNVHQSSFEEYDVKPEMCDVVFMGDVLEHLITPLEMLQKANKMLKPEGVVAVEVPSMFNSIVGRGAITAYRILGTKKKMLMPPYHVNEFTPKTLRAMLKMAGYKRSVIIQRIKRPDSITLRGTIFEKMAKRGLQYPNYFITKSFGILGDRLLGIGIK